MQNEISCCQNDQLLIRWDKTFSKIYKGPCLRLASYRSIDNNFFKRHSLAFISRKYQASYVHFSVKSKDPESGKADKLDAFWLAANDWVSSQYFPRHMWEGGLKILAPWRWNLPLHIFAIWPAKLWAFELRMFSVVEFFAAFYRIRTLRQLEENLAAR